MNGANMKWKSLMIVGLLAVPVFAKFYIVTIKRIDDDLYKDTENDLFIETKYCHERVSGEEAVLKYSDYSYDNKLIFENGTTCDVKRVFK